MTLMLKTFPCLHLNFKSAVKGGCCPELVLHLDCVVRLSVALMLPFSCQGRPASQAIVLPCSQERLAKTFLGMFMSSEFILLSCGPFGFGVRVTSAS